MAGSTGAAGYSNCCKDSGWGQDIGLAKCMMA
ncbi:conjugal transfer protein TraN [Escherichia coli]|nr:conjugal transfer protein TraN [Escherichia coli]